MVIIRLICLDLHSGAYTSTKLPTPVTYVVIYSYNKHMCMDVASFGLFCSLDALFLINKAFLNQVLASLQPACAWFLKIISV